MQFSTVETKRLKEFEYKNISACLYAFQPNAGYMALTVDQNEIIAPGIDQFLKENVAIHDEGDLVHAVPLMKNQTRFEVIGLGFDPIGNLLILSRTGVVQVVSPVTKA